MGTALGMLVSSAVLHRFNSGIVALIGIVCYNLLYLQLILLGTHSADFVVLLGITNGIASAFYWMSYSQLLTENSDLTNRDSALAIISIAGAVVNLIVPFVSGAAISAIGGEHGYKAVFILAFVIAVFTAIGAITLPKHKHAPTPVQHLATIHHVLRNKSLLFALLSELCKGIREGAFGFILTILLYKFIKSELLIGFNTLLASAASIVSFLIMSRRVNGKNRIKFMRIAAVSLLIFSAFNIFTISPLVLILFTVVNSFFSGFIVNSSFGTFLDAIQLVSGSEEKRPELFAQKELFLATGRSLGILVLILINTLTGGSVLWQAIALTILSLTQIGTIALSKHAMRLVRELTEKNSAAK
jgi:MFS family permease